MKKIKDKIRDIRKKNKDRYKTGKTALILCYPVFILLIAEMNQLQSLRELISYSFGNINEVLFALFHIAIFFAALFFISNSAVTAMAVSSFVMYLFSCIGHYKYEVSGTLFTIADLSMAGSLSDITSFAQIKIKPMLVLNLIILILYIGTVYLLNTKIKLKRLKSLVSGVMFAALFAVLISVPVTVSGVSELFKMDSDSYSALFSGSRNIRQPHFTVPFIESITNRFLHAVQKPHGYSEQSVLSALLPADSIDKNIRVKPNIIFVMSEAYADFRLFPGAWDIPGGTYANFDSLASEGHSGICAVPTFGGYTARTEFEILFGLPVHSLNTPEIPHQRVNISDDTKPPSMANFYKSQGYETAYIHPFSSTFYNRDDVYPLYGFDKLYFADNFTVPARYRGKYIDDYTTFDMLMSVLESSYKPQYIAVTTMQNHVPYTEDRDASGIEEYTAYLNGIQATDKALGILRERLLEYGEPAVLVFLGDHFPSFTAEADIYDILNITADTNTELYEQRYFIWSNYSLDFSDMENHPVLSAFYLPNITAELIGLPKSALINTVLNRIDEMPVYSPNYIPADVRDDVLDLLVYDVFLGENYLYGITD